MKPTSKVSFKIAAAMLGILLRTITRMEVRGRENLPRDGAIIAVCNHVHLLDPIIHILSILPRDSIFMAKEELFSNGQMPLIPFLMNVAEAFPVRRRGTPQEIEEALHKADSVLAEGHVFGIYPEGMRSKAGRLRSAYHGAAKIALRSGAPLIPVGISGTEKLNGIGWMSRPRVVVNFGKPFSIPTTDTKPTNLQLQAFTEAIMAELCSVLPQEYHGRYGIPANSIQDSTDGDND